MNQLDKILISNGNFLFREASITLRRLTLFLKDKIPTFVTLLVSTSLVTKTPSCISSVVPDFAGSSKDTSKKSAYSS